MAELDTGTVEGGGDGGDDDSTTTATVSATFEDIAPDWLISNTGTLRRFLLNPIGFVAGAVLAILIGGIQTVMEAVLLAIQSVFDAIASVPTSAASVFTDAGAYAAGKLFKATITFNDAIIGAAANAGLAAPVIGTLVIVVEGIVLLVVLEKSIKIAIDAIPGGGGLLS